MMYLALSYDHRIVDGREAVTFLVRVKEALEDPEPARAGRLTDASRFAGAGRHGTSSGSNAGSANGSPGGVLTAQEYFTYSQAISRARAALVHHVADLGAVGYDRIGAAGRRRATASPISASARGMW